MSRHTPNAGGLIVGMLIPILISLWIFFTVRKNNKKNQTQNPLPWELFIGSFFLGVIGLIICLAIYYVRRKYSAKRRSINSSPATIFTPPSSAPASPLGFPAEPIAQQTLVDPQESSYGR